MIRINKVHKIWRQSRDVLAGLAFIATGLGCTASDVPIALESQTAIPVSYTHLTLPTNREV